MQPALAIGMDTSVVSVLKAGAVHISVEMFFFSTRERAAGGSAYFGGHSPKFEFQ